MHQADQFEENQRQIECDTARVSELEQENARLREVVKMQTEYLVLDCKQCGLSEFTERCILNSDCKQAEAIRAGKEVFK